MEIPMTPRLSETDQWQQGSDSTTLTLFSYINHCDHCNLHNQVCIFLTYCKTGSVLWYLTLEYRGSQRWYSHIPSVKVWGEAPSAFDMSSIETPLNRAHEVDMTWFEWSPKTPKGCKPLVSYKDPVASIIQGALKWVFPHGIKPRIQTAC